MEEKQLHARKRKVVKRPAAKSYSNAFPVPAVNGGTVKGKGLQALYV